MTSDLPNDVIGAIREDLFAGRKIEAIKRYREATGCGLKESKELVERLEAELRTQSPELFTAGPAGCSAAILMVAAVTLTGAQLVRACF